MSELAAWQPLPLLKRPGYPALLISLSFGPSSYSVHLTDLANVWSEHLDRRAICMRGWKENTTIDPSDTPENMSKFLSCLKSALDGFQTPGQNTASVRLSADSSEAGPDGLTLRITCPLPGFPPLRWPMFLAKQPPSAISTDLLLPLIQAQSVKMRQMDYMIDLLQKKDVVIAKLLDKIESSGVALENVFTALAGRRKVTRSVAEDKVKGLAPFDLHEWKTSGVALEDGPADFTRLLATVFGDEGLVYQAEQIPLGSLENWWKSTGSVDMSSATNLALEGVETAPEPLRIVETVGKRSPPPISIANPLPKALSSDTDDDAEFQFQSTPPRLSLSKELTRPSTRKPDFLPPKAPLPAESETESEAEEDKKRASPPRRHSPTSPPPHWPESAPKKKVLGKIGAKQAPVVLPQEDSAPPLSTVVATSGLEPQPTVRIDTGPPLRKLGKIGKPSEPPAKGDPDRGRLREVVDTKNSISTTPVVRGTSAERADRRREELKREREQKIAAGPKKKRRF